MTVSQCAQCHKLENEVVIIYLINICVFFYYSVTYILCKKKIKKIILHCVKVKHFTECKCSKVFPFFFISYKMHIILKKMTAVVKYHQPWCVVQRNQRLSTVTIEYLFIGSQEFCRKLSIQHSRRKEQSKNLDIIANKPSFADALSNVEPHHHFSGHQSVPYSVLWGKTQTSVKSAFRFLLKTNNKTPDLQCKLWEAYLVLATIQRKVVSVFCLIISI